MERCRTRLLLVLTFLTGPALAVKSVSADLHHPAALPCQRNCLGWIRWTVFNKRDDVLAQCNQTACSSREGFNILHDQYLKGDLTLSISAADYSKRTWYICRCNGKDVCEVRLGIKPLISSVQKRPGEDLLLDLSITDPIELIYNSRESDASSGHRICMVEEAVLRCIAEYEQRASLNHSVINLSEVMPSDSGVYIIQDVEFNDVIHMYTVTVEKDLTEAGGQQEGAVKLWVFGVTVAVIVMMAIVLVALGFWRKHQHKVKRRWRSNRSISGTELNELIDKQNHERCSSGRPGPSRQRSLSDSYSIPLMMNNIQELAHVEKHNSGEGMLQNCMDLNCSIVLEQLIRKMVEVDQFISKYNRNSGGGGSSDGAGEGVEWKKLEDQFMESWKKKREELYNLIMLHRDQARTYHCTIHPDGRSPSRNITSHDVFYTGNGTAPIPPTD